VRAACITAIRGATRRSIRQQVTPPFLCPTFAAINTRGAPTTLNGRSMSERKENVPLLWPTVPATLGRW
jgi:hypothetical protein